MSQKVGQSRIQYGLFATPLEDMISDDNIVRVIDAFVDAMDLTVLGFKPRVSTMGASSYSPEVLMKIYFYGYFNRIRSSRCLERECHRNIELMWLTEQQTPCYHTISTFRTYQEKDEEGKVTYCHRKALKAVFKWFVDFCNGVDLIGKELVAVDGTKIAAQNSKKKHISADKLERKLTRVENRIEEYMDELDKFDIDFDQHARADVTAHFPEAAKILAAVDELKNNQSVLLGHVDLLVAAQAADPSATQICFTDPEARMLPINNEGMMQIAYNVQSSVDEAHKLIVQYSVENCKDVYLLGSEAVATKEALGLSHDAPLDLLADKGYHSGKGLQACIDANVTTYVAVPEQGYKDRPRGFQKADFKYDAESDSYTCPNKQELTTSGSLHEKHGRQGHLQYKYKLYRSSFSICNDCPFKDSCLSASSIAQRHGRVIERSEYEEATEANKQRMLANRDKYKKRQAIVEHPFGTIKRSWGYSYTLLKGKEKVSGEMGLIFTVYNFRRVINILGITKLLEALKCGKVLDLRLIRAEKRHMNSGKSSFTGCGMGCHSFQPFLTKNAA